METKDIVLGALVGAGGIGAALYFTGYLKKDITPLDRLPVLPMLPRIASPSITMSEPSSTSSPVISTSIDIETIKREAAAAAETKVKEEFAAREAAIAAEAERKRLTGEGWSRKTARQGKGAAPKAKLEIPPGWDDAKYLAKYPDVAKAVEAGAFPSGLAHYFRYGKQEGRTLDGWIRRPGYLSGVMSNWGFNGFGTLSMQPKYKPLSLSKLSALALKFSRN